MASEPRRLYPPVVYGSGLLVALLGHVVRPLRLHRSPWLRAFGVVAVAASGALARSAVRTFERSSTTVHPFHEASALVTEGPFRFSRNPIYLAFTTSTVGTALVAASWWPLLALAPVLRVMTGIIGWEEQMLRRVFGAEYEAYTRRTRRWL